MRYKYETPKTNARWETLCCSGQSWYQIADEMKLDCRQLERELTAVTEQRDAVTLRLGNTQERMFNAERQRDRLAEALLELRDNESLSLGGAAYKIVEQALQYEMVEQSLQSLTTN
jgi:hypothetical protein